MGDDHESKRPVTGNVFFTSDRVSIYHHESGGLELRCDGIRVLPPAPHQIIVDYAKAEFCI